MLREAVSAIRLLEKNGELVTIQFPGLPNYDPVTGSQTNGSVGQSVEASGYPGKYMSGSVDGNLIRQNDVRLILQLIDPRPTAGCSALVDGVTYQVLDVQTIRKAGEDVLFVCQLRAS